MPGLMSREMAPPERTARPPMADGRMSREEDTAEPEGMAADAEQPNVSPEEQAQYDRFMANYFKLAHGEKSSPAVLKNLEGAGDPVKGLAMTAAMMTRNVEESAEKNGVQLADGVVFHGGRAILEDLAELSEAAGQHDYSEDEMEAAWFQALDLYRGFEEATGKVDQEQAKMDLEGLQRLDAEGRLDEEMPGASEFAGRAGKKAPPAEGAQEQAPPRRGLGG